jgi:hypothetical protein
MTQSPRLIAEIERQVDELQTAVAEQCGGKNVAIIASVMMNILGECFVALAARPDLFDGLARQVQEIPEKARALAAPTKAH